MNEKKYKSVVVIWGVIFLILQTLALINVVGLRPLFYSYLTKLITSFIATIVLALIIIFMVLSLRKKKAGPIIGIIIGAVYVTSLNILNLIVGICFIISCVGLLKELQKEKKVEQNVEKSDEA